MFALALCPSSIGRHVNAGISNSKTPHLTMDAAWLSESKMWDTDPCMSMIPVPDLKRLKHDIVSNRSWVA